MAPFADSQSASGPARTSAISPHAECTSSSSSCWWSAGHLLVRSYPHAGSSPSSETRWYHRMADEMLMYSGVRSWATSRSSASASSSKASLEGATANQFCPVVLSPSVRPDAAYCACGRGAVRRSQSVARHPAPPARCRTASRNSGERVMLALKSASIVVAP